MKKIFTSILMVGLAFYTNAQRILTEDFNYTPGQLTSANAGANVSGGNWVTNTGTGSYLQVTSPGLTYANYNTGASATNNNKLALNGVTTSAEDAYRSFTTPVTAGTLYMSFLLNARDLTNMPDNTTVGDYFAGFISSTSTTNFLARVYAKKGVTANTFVLGISVTTAASTVGGVPNYATIELAPNVTHLVTVSYTFVAGALNDEARIFINKPYSTTEPAADATSIYAGTTAESADIGKIFVRQGTGPTPNADIDGFKVSTTYADATLSAPAPLTLTSFRGSLSDRGVQLNWTSANEQDVRSYTIERSTDSRTFTAIGAVDAQNIDQATYTFRDNSPLQGVSYYRLEMKDKDGTIKMSPVVVIKNGKTTALQIFPNPVSDFINVAHEKAAANASIKIYSIGGQQIKSFIIQSGAMQTSLPVDDLVKGNYLLSFDNNGESTVIKFIKN